MKRRKQDWLGALFALSRSTTRAGTRLGKTVGKIAAKQAKSSGKAARHALSGVITPGPKPQAGPRGGKWLEGRWGLGPMAMRRYWLYLPPGASARRPAPLIMLLHGCSQDAAGFAASTRAASFGRSKQVALLLPEQAQEANPQRCWNWFGADALVNLETAILKSILDHVCTTQPVRAGQCFAMGISAGGAMSLTLALRYPQAFVAVASHSGAAPNSAGTLLQAGQTLRGRRLPDVEELAERLGNQHLPPLLVLHGDADLVVAPPNGDASVGLWLTLATGHGTISSSTTELARGSRYPCVRVDWKLDGKPLARLLRIRGLGHAWSGGIASQAFSDPRGPDALRLAWQYFSTCLTAST